MKEETIVNDSQKGLYGKYVIGKADGSPMIERFRFVLSPENDQAALEALKAYQRVTDNKQLKGDLENVIYAIEKGNECPHKNVTTWNHGYHSLCRDCGERDVY